MGRREDIKKARHEQEDCGSSFGRLKLIGPPIPSFSPQRRRLRPELVAHLLPVQETSLARRGPRKPTEAYISKYITKNALGASNAARRSWLERH